MEFAEMPGKTAMEREDELERALLLKNRILQNYSLWEGFLLSNGVKEKSGEGSGIELGRGDSLVGLGVLMSLRDPIGGALAIAMGSQKSAFEISNPDCLLSSVIERFILLEEDIRDVYRIKERLNEKERLRLDFISKSLSVSKAKVASLRKKLWCGKKPGRRRCNCRVSGSGPRLAAARQ